MKNILLEEYLDKLNSMNELLSKYSEVVIYKTEKEIEKGLLRFDKPPKGKAFLFVFPIEEVLHFHTIDMKFPIDIYFFNSKKELVSSYNNVKPGVEDISSDKSAMYAVETI